MKNQINDYLCFNCKHNLICVNKGVYKAFQDAVNEIEIPIPGTDRVSKIEGYDWLKPSKLECKYFLY